MVFQIGSKSDDLRRRWPEIGRRVRTVKTVLPGLLLLLALTAWQARPAAPSWQWERVEVGLPREAITLAVAVQPANPDVIWAAHYAPGGLVTSRDGGQTWWYAAEGLADAPVFDLLATQSTPGEPGRVWAATRDGLFWRDEAGDRWRPVEGLPPAAVFALAAEASGRLYAGLDGAGVYVQTPDGAGWEALASAEPAASAGVLAIAVSPDGRQIYLGLSGRGLLASRDGGRTWSGAYPDDYAANVAFKPGNPAIAVAALRDRVVRTLDGGQSWRTLTVPWDREWTVSLLWLANGTLNAGTARGRFYHSQDNGDSWTGGVTGLPPHGVLDLAVGTGSRLLAGSWVGLYDSRDGGRSWQALAPEIGSPNVETLLAVDGELLLGARTGLYRWSAGQDRWMLLSEDLPTGVVSLAVDPHQRERLYAGLVGEGLYRSPDGGISWQRLPTLHKDIPAIAVNPHDSDNLFILAAWERVYESRDGGQTWAARWDGLGEVLETVSLAVDPEESLIYVGAEQGLYRRQNDDQSWEPAAPDLADQSVLTLLARPAPDSPQGSVLYIGATRGVYRSLDQGTTTEGGGDRWGRGLENISVTALLAGAKDEQALYAGTADHGIYVSRDGGQTWQPIGPAALSGGVVESMAWGPAGDLFVLTTGEVWRGQPQ